MERGHSEVGVRGGFSGYLDSGYRGGGRGGVRLGENGSIERERGRGGRESRGREMKGSLRFRVTRDLAGVVRLFF